MLPGDESDEDDWYPELLPKDEVPKDEVPKDEVPKEKAPHLSNVMDMSPEVC